MISFGDFRRQVSLACESHLNRDAEIVSLWVVNSRREKAELFLVGKGLRNQTSVV